ncbi:DUF998 domain-containing protein [Kineosporia mesophila]|uniref:DUF998 domain-containing protein n=1 Tax=Kineosporia mesophila TaxID=566012 RepID=A0ABP6ZAX9_9ACTN|nr:DUF998 domain-containing protein [Kineosporia mesophila]MCD5354908.1 DUF998 domain-containing protein [Kineosporia mesophila]
MRSPAAYSSTAAPVLLIGGWCLAQARQPAAFDPLRNSISDLAAVGATDRWIMTLALLGVGLAHLVTAFSLTEAARPGRLLIGAGGVATGLVALFPLPGDGGSSPAHTASATAAFVALAVWPLLGAARSTTPLLRPPISIVAGAILLALAGWFALTLFLGGPLGLAERVAAGAQAVWPLLVVLGVRRAGPSD